MELDAIAACLRATRVGDGRALLFEGPAGIGKTTLLSEACALARRDGMLTLTARGADLERSFPYGVVRQLFERSVLGGAAGRGPPALAGAAGLSAPVFGLARPDGLLPPSDEREAALIGLYWLMTDIADSAPLVVAVDDLQWTDAASLEWLLYALPRMAGVRATVIAAARPGEAVDDAQAGLLAEVGGHADVVLPEPLGEEAVGELLEAVLGAEVDAAVRGACFQMTMGNPLLVNAVGRALADSGRPPGEFRADDVERVSSPRLSRLVQNRLRSVSEPAAELARAIATLGPDAELAHAAALTGLRADSAAAAADELRARNLLAADARLAFVHPVVARAVRDDIPSGRRGVWHARAARLLADAHASPERVAAHLLRSEPAHEQRTADQLRAAARDAVGRGAPQSAVPLLERGLREAAPHGRGDLLFELGRAEAVLMSPAAIEHLRAAYDLAAPGRPRSQVALALGRTLVASRLSESARFLAAAIDEAGASDPEIALRMEAIMASGLRMDAEWAPRVSERLRSRARDPPVGETDGERSLLACIAGETTVMSEPVDTAVRHATTALAGGRLLRAETCESAVFLFACMSLTCAGRFALSRRHLGDALVDARARGSVLGFAFGSTFRAEAAFGAGDLREAEADARAALEAIGGRPAIVAAPLVMGWLALALIEQGRTGEAAAVLAAWDPDTAMLPEAAYSPVKHALGVHALAVRDATRARSQLLEAGNDLLASLCPTPTLLPWRSEAARAAALLGELDVARSEAAEELRLAQAARAPRAIGVALRAVALVGPPVGRVEQLREAVAALESSEARLDHAHALCDLGVALRHAGAARDAREPLRLSADIAAACHAVPLTERARAELLASGARPRRSRVFGRDALTPAELRVAELAAAGLSNREIAQTLFVTVKTIETQLGAAYRKLGIASRRQLGGALTAEAAAEP
jgi:DNA-binding CsgD family transcriptional regulator